jgi:hypothetical protein
MKGALRFVIFALLCVYAHAQCCVGGVSTNDGKDPVNPKTEADCGKASGSWNAACATGTSCMSIKCSGKQGSTAWSSLGSLCTTEAINKLLIEAAAKNWMADGKITEVKCASGGPSSKFASGALLMVSAFVSLVVASV